MKDVMRKNGYDNEEVYFAKVNRELIDRIQARERAKRRPGSTSGDGTASNQGRRRKAA